jgi:hypothetical protein
MCEFCEKILKEDDNTLLTSKINNLGVLGEMEVGIWIYKLEDKVILETVSTGPFCDIEEANIKINYCPICGREITDQ